MSSSYKKIGISLRIVDAETYDEQRDALSHDWALFLGDLKFFPILIPNTFPDLELFLNSLELDGLILSGGDNIGDTPIRDEIERKIIEYSIRKKTPLLGICRGMQILNEYFGGRFLQTNSSEHIAQHHDLKISHSEFSNFLTNSITVNSYHKNVIKQETMGKGLETFANCIVDNTVEGFFHKEYPILGVMWHPEREPNSINKSIFKIFFSTDMFWS